MSKNMSNESQENKQVTQNAPSVLIQTYPTDCGHVIGEMTLNSPASLNALSIDMCQRMSKQLSLWQNDDNVVAILLRGAGDKAFCAGGDIRKLYDSMADHDPSTPNPYATAFFGNEYDLYRQMHFYTKPLILWGSGIVMGGGMGLMTGCSHRIITETTRFAMPEITIGLFPDATGSWFLQRMPAKMGLFLGLTGAQCNGADALLVNLAEYAVASDSYEAVVAALTTADWRLGQDKAIATPRHLEATASRTLATLAQAQQDQLSLKPSQLGKYWRPIQTLMSCGGLADIDATLQDDAKLAAIDSDFAADTWSQRAVATYRRGCPVTAALTYEIFHRVGALSLEQILYLETNVAANCANNPDFREGVRALLIDKDKNPQWSKSLAECLTPEGQAYINGHFHSPYAPGEHPFADWLSDQALAVQAVR